MTEVTAVWRNASVVAKNCKLPLNEFKFFFESVKVIEFHATDACSSVSKS
jgi:hypothetical protein